MNITPGLPVPNISVGGLLLATAGLKILQTHVNSNSLSVFYDSSFGVAPAVYQVPVGKTFWLQAWRWISVSPAAAGPSAGLYYGDTSLGVDSAVPLVNPVGMISGIAGAVSINNPDFCISGYSINGVPQEGVGGGKVPASKYPHMFINGVFGHAWLYGYEA